MKNKLRQLLRASSERSLARAEGKLQYIQSLIDRGKLGGLTYYRLNAVCRRIRRLEEKLTWSRSAQSQTGGGNPVKRASPGTSEKPMVAKRARERLRNPR
jgi:hypothetical protein